jgi:hypothetical protein
MLMLGQKSWGHLSQTAVRPKKPKLRQDHAQLVPQSQISA